MNFYISPFSRMARRRWMERAEQEAEGEQCQSSVFVPVNVSADKDAFVITMLMPGLKAEDVDIEIVNDAVIIKGELKVPAPEDANYLLREIPTGCFQRILRMPVEVDAEKAEAKMENGILTLRIPKAETVRPRTIKINAA
ncbi:MAG TPA: Hsp20/alpha crystallin family protein [Anaerolineaceae bacterium]|nr:Hsp20/alpha crystallin family protein [Anaerolineaceae bacterium]HPN50499.1 Hsp20/alpha crystallin family protein [Anaerolineaceae bacterium]